MFFHFSLFFHSLLFLFGLEAIAIWPDGVAYFIALLFASTLYGCYRAERGFRLFIVPLLFVISAVSLLYLIDSGLKQQVFIVASACIYYLALLGMYRFRRYEKDQTARSMVALAVMSTFFFFYSGFYGIYLNFSIPVWFLMLVYCVGTAMVSYQYFGIIEKERSRLVSIYSLILGLAMAEIGWIINFWPFGYLTTGVISLIFYYILWDLTQSYFLNMLSQGRVITHIICFGLLMGMVLLSSRWLPAV